MGPGWGCGGVVEEVGRVVEGLERGGEGGRGVTAVEEGGVGA